MDCFEMQILHIIHRFTSRNDAKYRETAPPEGLCRENRLSIDSREVGWGGGQT